MGLPIYATLGLHEPWFITREYAGNWLPVLAALLRGEQPAMIGDKSESRAWHRTRFVVPGQFDDSWDDDEDIDEEPTVSKPAPGSVAIMRLRGPVMKYSQFCGPRGTVDYARDLLSLESDPNVIGTVFYIESGGGQSYAVKPLTDVMQRIKKPLVILGGSVVASAAFYISVYGREIVVEHPRSVIGSMGTMLPIQDIQPALEKLGVAFHDIYATRSTRKNLDYREALKNNYGPITKGWLDPLQEDFEQHVREQRPSIAQDERIYQGDTFLADEALKLKMIDYLGDMEFAIGRVQALASGKPASSPSTNSKQHMDNVTALAGVENATQEQLDLANADLTAAGVTGYTIVPESMIDDAAAVTTERDNLQAENTRLTTELTTATGDRDTARNELATANTRITELEAENTRLGQLPGAKHERSVGEDEDPDGEDVQSILDNLPHNKRADALLG